MPPHSDDLAAHPAVSIPAEPYSKDPAPGCGCRWPRPDPRRGGDWLVGVSDQHVVGPERVRAGDLSPLPLLRLCRHRWVSRLSRPDRFRPGRSASRPPVAQAAPAGHRPGRWCARPGRGRATAEPPCACGRAGSRAGAGRWPSRLAVVVSQAPGLGRYAVGRPPFDGGGERLGGRLLGDVKVTENARSGWRPPGPTPRDGQG
jgi:hypothetical protein